MMLRAVYNPHAAVRTEEGDWYVYRGMHLVAGPFLTKAAAQSWIDKVKS